MCGRYVSVASDPDLTLEFDVEETLDGPPAASWNVAPTDSTRIVVERRPPGSDDDAAAVHLLRTARWGLVPSWAKDARGGARMINARIETVTSKPAFAKAAAARRCLVPALGYYEWKQVDGGKVPYFLHDPDGELLAFAGLYELWRDRTRADDDPQRWLCSYTIITQQATDLLGEIHDRNPVVLPRALRERWLDCSTGDVAVAQQLLDELDPARLEPYEVGKAVGNVNNDGPDLIAPASTPAIAEPVQQALEL
ncbi:SOS response-associated peptidase [uncultured Jatrophihabitans sp.]|uniref:SOS response-associated peptidase n=1 Tax=uncultured Jatrophihabitans sp. TaxID=1610747 RepID=UPI0035C9D7A2